MILIKHFVSKSIYTLFFCLSALNSFSQNESVIRGHIELDSTIWNPIAYFSYIPTFDDMYTMSGDMVITATKIDSTGHFIFDTSFLPEDNNLYRIHISKKNAPPMSLIIGGEEENHIFLIAHKSSNILIKSKNSSSIFNDALFPNDVINSDFQNVTHIVKNEENININATIMQRRLVKESTQNQLKSIAKENSHPLVSLYAFYKCDLGYIEDKTFIKTFDEKWISEDSAYFNTFRNTYIEEPTANHYLVFLFICLFLLIAGYVLKNKRSSFSKKQLQSLSIQERKILYLLQEGKSNKEISEECHIGLSTVKSHVSSIYSKLNVKSRKEAIGITIS